MARKPSPWYREERNEWCVTVGGKHHRLGEHPAAAPKPKRGKRGWNAPREVLDAFYKLMRGDNRPQDADSVVAVLDDFLTWCQENRAGRTYDRYQEFIQDFVRDHGRLNVSALTTAHVTAWLNGRPTWNTTTKRNAITALQRGFNWAAKNRGLSKNPIRGMEKPQAKRRTQVVTPEEFEHVLTLVKDTAFKDLLVVSYDSGCRPQEVKGLEARHLQFDKQRAVLPAEEAKGKRYPRPIYFPTGRSMEAVRRLAEAHPTGPLFRNNRGKPWTSFAVKCRFADVEVALGREEMRRRGIESKVTEEAIAELMAILPQRTPDKVTGKLVDRKPWVIRQQAKEKLVVAEARQYGKRFRHYSLRHSFVTRKLVAGVDSHVVAALAGHRDTKMIDTVYSHVAGDHAFMLEQAKKDVGGPPAKVPPA